MARGGERNQAGAREMKRPSASCLVIIEKGARPQARMKVYWRRYVLGMKAAAEV